jgi:hypothetical protein
MEGGRVPAKWANRCRSTSPVRMDSPTARLHIVAACTLSRRPRTASMHLGARRVRSACRPHAGHRGAAMDSPWYVCSVRMTLTRGRGCTTKGSPHAAAAPAPPLHESVTRACAKGSVWVYNYWVGRMHEGSWQALVRLLANLASSRHVVLAANSPPVLLRRALRSHTGRVCDKFTANGQIPLCFVESWARRATCQRFRFAGHSSAGEVPAGANCETSVPPASIAQRAYVAFCTPGPPTCSWRED